MRNVITLVLGGGRGTRLYPLTKFRSKPAVPLAGKYRLIDIPLSNCINSDLRRIYVLTQFMSVSLHRHIRQTYRFDSFSAGFVEILAAQQTMDGTDWYEGTADAVRKNVRYLEQSDIDYVVILSGDQLYRMDYREMIKTHIESEADATIAAIPVDRKDAAALGIMRLGEDGSVHGFVEKPSTEEQLSPVLMDPAWIEARGIESRGRECLASMGIYVFNRDLLVDVLKNTSYQDFGKEIFPTLIKPKNVQVHLFDGYWEDIGTIQAFYNANLQLATDEPPFDLISPEAPLYSRARFLPPSRLDGVNIRNSLVADGCRISPGVKIENSVIGLRCTIGENVTIRDSVIMGADEYETYSELRDDHRFDRPPIGIGADSLIVGSIVDKNCHIGRGVKIIPRSDYPDGLHESGPCAVCDGIPVILKDAIVPDGWQLE
ncbi:MAG: glucose-1-phosphate adenylyltransferase [Planctomycetaceae bacterium]|nr:glucose-1-phosphate adenylyltransferase [Planctomycetaceae bacterium]